MQVYYLEIVTPDVEAVCTSYAKIHSITFGEPEPVLGHARTARLQDGGLVGVRAPMRDSEEPVIRPYTRVEDMTAAVKSIELAGGTLAHPPLELPGYGTFAIYIQGGLQHGLWQT